MIVVVVAVVVVYTMETVYTMQSKSFLKQVVYFMALRLFPSYTFLACIYLALYINICLLFYLHIYFMFKTPFNF